MTKELERVGVPTAQISAIYEFAMTTGANRVVRGSRIEHVCGDPDLGPDKDYAYGLRIVRTALKALRAPVDGPTLFDPVELLEV
jgi:glycine/betaine/sarcosine/D-proline reductase family selenoprotein B